MKNIEILTEIIQEKGFTGEVNLNMDLRVELKMDSLDVISFLFEVEKRTEIHISEDDIDSKNLFILKNLLNYLDSQ